MGKFYIFLYIAYGKLNLINCCMINEKGMSLLNEMKFLLATFDPGTLAYYSACVGSFYIH